MARKGGNPNLRDKRQCRVITPRDMELLVDMAEKVVLALAAEGNLSPFILSAVTNVNISGITAMRKGRKTYNVISLLRLADGLGCEIALIKRRDRNNPLDDVDTYNRVIDKYKKQIEYGRKKYWRKYKQGQYTDQQIIYAEAQSRARDTTTPKREDDIFGDS